MEYGNIHDSGSQQALRRRNMQVLLSSLRVEGPATRRELADRTGFSSAQISNLVRLLVKEQLAATSHTVHSGRRAVMVESTS
jgi:DNA-binding MarR family transcriptional regulator